MRLCSTLFIAAGLLVTGTTTFAQDISEYQFEFDYEVAGHSRENVIAESYTAEDDNIEDYENGSNKRVAPYQGNITVAAGYEHAKTQGTDPVNEKYEQTKNGGQLKLSLPVLKGGASSLKANLLKMSTTVGVGEVKVAGATADSKKLSKKGVYWHAGLGPTVNLKLQDAPMVFEKGMPAPLIGLEAGALVGISCEHMSTKTKRELGITDKDCAATVGATIKGNLWYLYGGFDIKHKLGQQNNAKDKTEIMGTIGIEVPLSNNLTDIEADDSGRGHSPKLEDAPTPANNDYYNDSGKAASV